MLVEHESLKNALRAARGVIPENHATRLHRAISWLQCAGEQTDNLDLQFMSLWVCFNACYSTDGGGDLELSVREEFRKFARRLVEHDTDGKIFRCLWKKYSGPVRMLINSHYVYAPFWAYYQRQMQFAVKADKPNWRAQFDKSVKDALRDLQDENVPELLCTVLGRLYVLRNQLMHGGATYKSRVNRKQVKDGSNILAALMPIIIEIMMAAPKEDWGKIAWPVVKD